MIDADAFATLLCDWCLDVRERDYVLVFTTTLAAPLVRALHRALIMRGAWAPGFASPSPGLPRTSTTSHPTICWTTSRRSDLAEMERIDAYLRIDAPENTRALAEIDPATLARAARARSPIQEVRLGKRWCGTLWPTPALAQEAGMSDDDYAAFVKRALFLDRPDPVAAWRELSGSPATDRRPPDARPRDPDRGRRNRPAPARRRSYLDQLQRPAQYAERRGVHRAARGLRQRDDPLRVPLESARGLRRRRGAHVRGRQGHEAPPQSGARTTSTPRSPPTPARAFSESLGSAPTPASTARPARSCSTRRSAGTVHLALGRSYPETGGRNVSALHWDLICDLRDGGRLTADGEPIA